MDQSLSICPQCRERYSTSLPTTQHKSRCSLPLTLTCGHGACYQCIVSKRRRQKSSLATSPQKVSTKNFTICCSVCKEVSTIPIEAVQNILTMVNSYQLGLTHLEELEVDIAGDSICFKDGFDCFYSPQNSETVVKKPSFDHPGNCPKHNISMNYWCYEDKAALCSSCRVSHHFTHDVVKITEKNKEELNDYYQAVDETTELLQEMKKTFEAIEERNGQIGSEYRTISKQIRRNFGDLHAILAVREHQVQQELIHAFRDCTEPLKAVGHQLREAYFDINMELQKADLSVNDAEATRSGITHCTQSLRRFSFYRNPVKETFGRVDDAALSASVESVPKFAESLLKDEAVSLHVDSSTRQPLWTKFKEEFNDLQKMKNQVIVESMNAKSPSEPIKKKKARKQLNDRLDGTPVIVSQVASQCTVGSELAGLVVYVDVDQFYVQIQGEWNADLEILQGQIQLFDSKPIPRLNYLHAGQLVAGRYSANGEWYRALIEEINHKCQDLVIFFIDYGNRELTSVENVRLLSENFSRLPAQAVRCIETTKPPKLQDVLFRSQTKVVRMNVDQIQSGGVGRLDGPELTVWVVLLREPASSQAPIWTLPDNNLEPLAWPSTVYKERSTPTPLPAGAVARKKRFPASKSSTSDGVPRLPTYVLPPATDQGQENRHRSKIILAYCNSPGEFYVRMESAQKTFLHLSQQLESHLTYDVATADNRLNSTELAAGLICAVRLEQWNRCRIVRLNQDDTVVVRLLDFGRILTVSSNQLFRLDQPHWTAIPATALHCRLWGVRPAGHVSSWSRSSSDKMADSVKLSSSLYIQMYLVEEEESQDGTFQSIHYVRFYYEYLKPGGPLEFDQILTECLNDRLLDSGLALRQQMAVTYQPTPKRWLPSLVLPPELEAIPVLIDNEGLLYIQRQPGPFNHLELITRLLNWHYAKSSPTMKDSSHWEKDEPCVARYQADLMWYRAVVEKANDETKTASVIFVDYGNREDVPYGDMRKTLICFEYAIQANRVRLSKYPGFELKATEEELSLIHHELINKPCQVRVTLTSSEPLVDVRHLTSGLRDLNEVFEFLRPSTGSTRSVRSARSALPTPAPTIQSSSVDLTDSVFDDNSSEFSDDVYPTYHFDELRHIEADMYQPLDVSERHLLPIRIVSLDEQAMKAVIQPTRHWLNDSPMEWYDQVDGFARLETELQRSAPLFPDIEVVDHGSPCACHNPKDDRWYRGIVVGYADDSLRIVRVELVDIGTHLDLSSCRIKQLPTEYLNLARHSTTSRLIDYPMDAINPPDLTNIRQCVKEETPLLAFFLETTRPLQMTLFYQDSNQKFVPAFELE